MKFKLEFDMGNAAFHDAPNGCEAARILRQLAERLDGGTIAKSDGWHLSDSNGNKVGEWKITR